MASFYDDQPNLYKVVKYIMNNCEKITTQNLHYLLFISDLEYSENFEGHFYTEGKYIRCNGGVIHNRLGICLDYMDGIELVVDNVACRDISGKLNTRWSIDDIDKEFIKILEKNMFKFGYKKHGLPILKNYVYELEYITNTDLGDLLLSSACCK
jgi:hypothetical protein